MFKDYEILQSILSKKRLILFIQTTKRESAQDLKLNIYHATFYLKQENQIKPLKFCYEGCTNLKNILKLLNTSFKLMFERY